MDDVKRKGITGFKIIIIIIIMIKIKLNKKKKTKRANSPYSIPPDGFTFRAGVTTAACPSMGWKNFRQFRDNVIMSQVNNFSINN